MKVFKPNTNLSNLIYNIIVGILVTTVSVVIVALVSNLIVNGSDLFNFLGSGRTN